MIQLSRFSRLFLCLVFLLLLIATTFVFQSSPSYKGITPGMLFGEGVEAHVGLSDTPYAGIEGDVIMGKLGNETAK